jgi:hypothetical protein
MGDVYPTYGGSKSIDQIHAMPSYVKLHPTMQERVTTIIVSSGGKVGLGQGFRSFEDQKTLFLANYVPDPSGDRGTASAGSMPRATRRHRPGSRCTSSASPPTLPVT